MRQLVRQAVEAAATWSAIPARRGLRVLELTHDDPVLIAALDELEPERGVALDHYRVLLEPTDAQKKNIVVLENDAPLAVLGLRRRPDYELTIRGPRRAAREDSPSHVPAAPRIGQG